MLLVICLKEIEKRVQSSAEGVYKKREMSSDLKTVKGVVLYISS